MKLTVTAMIITTTLTTRTKQMYIPIVKMLWCLCSKYLCHLSFHVKITHNLSLTRTILIMMMMIVMIVYSLLALHLNRTTKSASDASVNTINTLVTLVNLSLYQVIVVRIVVKLWLYIFALIMLINNLQIHNQVIINLIQTCPGQLQTPYTNITT